MMMWQFMMMTGDQSGGGGSGGSLPLATTTVVTTLSSVDPDGIDFDQNGDMWIAGRNGDGLRRYNGISNSLAQTVDSGGDYRGVCFEPSSNSIFAAEYDDRYIYTRSGTTPNPGSLSFRPKDIAVFDGHLIVSDGGRLCVYSGLTTGSPIRVHTGSSLGIGTGSLLAVGCDGTNVMVGTTAGSVSVITGASLLTATPNILTSFTVSYDPYGFGHDGTYWYGCERSSGDIHRHNNA